MGFGNDAIAVVTKGLRRSTGSFAERLVSRGLIGDILSSAGDWFGFPWGFVKAYRVMKSWVVS